MARDGMRVIQLQLHLQSPFKYVFCTKKNKKKGFEGCWPASGCEACYPMVQGISKPFSMFFWLISNSL